MVLKPGAETQTITGTDAPPLIQTEGDSNANGPRAEQNPFILDGVDNSNNAVERLARIFVP